MTRDWAAKHGFTLFPETGFESVTLTCVNNGAKPGGRAVDVPKLQKLVRENKVLAYMWFSVAVSRSYYPENRKASMARNSLAARMTPAEIAEAQRLSQAWKPKKEK